MTLGELFHLLAANPILLVGYFLVIPLTALLAGILGRQEGEEIPWNYLYSLLVYLAAVPGIFALVLSVYFWLFEKRSILETDVYIQVLPIVSMALTFWLIRWNVPLEKVRGFGKLAGLLMMIFVVLLLMWLIDRTHIIAFTYLPFYWVILILVVLLVVFRLGWSRAFERQ